MWGGTTKNGFDCSGLTQKFYEEIFGILLPKHSRDQAVCGKKTNLKSARFGDLVFFRRKNRNYPHVGVVIENNKYRQNISKCTNEFFILNTRKENGGVAVEDLSKILKTYKLISIRKLL